MSALYKKVYKIVFVLNLMFNKRGQFFILAAVIISVIIVSLGVVHNYAETQREPERFYDLSYEIKQESARVIDFGVYTGEENINEFLGDYTQEVASSLRDKYPDIGFVFIYGNHEEVIIENYGKERSLFRVGDTEGYVEGADETTVSNINLEVQGTSVNKEVEQPGDLFKYKWRDSIVPDGDTNLVVTINEDVYEFVLEDEQSKQFFLVLIKSEGLEDYVDLQ